MKTPEEVAKEWLQTQAVSHWPRRVGPLAELIRQRDEEHGERLLAAQSLCGFYFAIAAKAVGEDEVRRQVNAWIEGRKEGEADG
jgi:hypothetical protein